LGTGVLAGYHLTILVRAAHEVHFASNVEFASASLALRRFWLDGRSIHLEEHKIGNCERGRVLAIRAKVQARIIWFRLSVRETNHPCQQGAVECRGKKTWLWQHCFECTWKIR